MKSRKISLESISLGDLQVIYQSEGGVFYRKIVSQMFAGRENQFAKNRLYYRRPLNLDKETKMNLETIHATQIVLSGEHIKTEFKEKEYSKTKALYDEKYAEFCIVKRELYKLEHDLNEVKKQVDEYHAAENKISGELSKLKSISDELNRVVLIHKSATVNQIKKYQHRKMIITKSDMPYLKCIGLCDDIFESEGNLIDIPYDMKTRNLTLDEISAINFVNMMVHFKIQGDVIFDAIYSDETISELLRFNKYDEL